MENKSDIDQQISDAKLSYPSLIVRGKNSYSIIYDDSPQNEFEILIKQSFPETPPLILMNGNKIQLSLVTFWHPNYTFLLILQHLHLFSVAYKNPNVKLSPPIKNEATPSIYKESIEGTNNFQNVFYGRLVSFSRESTCEEIIEEEEEDTVDNELYQKRLNDLNNKLKNKEIHVSEYMDEHQVLKKLTV